MYKFRLFGAAGKIVAVQQYFAFNDDEALSIAREMTKGAPARFDVWNGKRRVEKGNADGERNTSP